MYAYACLIYISIAMNSHLRRSLDTHKRHLHVFINTCKILLSEKTQIVLINLCKPCQHSNLLQKRWKEVRGMMSHTCTCWFIIHLPVIWLPFLVFCLWYGWLLTRQTNYINRWYHFWSNLIIISRKLLMLILIMLVVLQFISLFICIHIHVHVPTYMYMYKLLLLKIIIYYCTQCNKYPTSKVPMLFSKSIMYMYMYFQLHLFSVYL